jgi:hypothetical protein
MNFFTNHNPSDLTFVSVLISTAFLSACTTTLSGRKQGVEKGIEYSLPAPHIIMTPQSDGTVTVEVKYIADASNRYTLNLNSYFSSATFEVKTTNGMLDSVSLDSDASTIATKAITSTTDLQNKKMEKQEADRVAEKQKNDTAKANAKAQALAIKSIEDTIALLEDKLSVYKSKPNIYKEDQIAQVELEISQQRKQLELKKGNNGSADASTFNDPSSSENGKVFGPVLFRVMSDGNNGVRLVSAERQRSFDVPYATAAAPVSSLVIFTPAKVAVAETNKTAPITFKSNVPLELSVGETILVNPAISMTVAVLKANQIGLKIDSPKTGFQFTLPASLEKGNYLLLLTVVRNGQRATEGLEISWRK